MKPIRINTVPGTTGLDDHSSLGPPEASSGAPLLPDPGTDPVTALMQLMVKLHGDEREASRATELAAAKAEAAADTERIAAMHSKASSILVDGIVVGSMELGSAGLSVASTVVSTEGKLDELRGQENQTQARLDNDLPASREAAKECASAAIEQGRGAYLRDAAGAMSAAKDMTGAAFRSSEAHLDEDAARLEGDARRSGRDVDRAHEATQQHDGDLRAVLDWFRKMQDTRSATASALARRA